MCRTGESGNEASVVIDLSGNEGLVGFRLCTCGSMPALSILDVRMPKAPKRTPSVLSSPSHRAIGCEIRRVLARGGEGGKDGVRDTARDRARNAARKYGVLQYRDCGCECACNRGLMAGGLCTRGL